MAAVNAEARRFVQTTVERLSNDDILSQGRCLVLLVRALNALRRYLSFCNCAVKHDFV